MLGALFNLKLSQGSVQIAFCAVPFLVGVVEEFGDNHAFFVSDVDAWVGNAVKEGVAWRDLFVEDAEFTDNPGIDIG